MMWFPPDSVAYDQSIEPGFKDLTPNVPQTAGDHFAHAAGRICKTCDHPIEAGQPARRRGASSWVHDVCPFVEE